MDIFQLYATDSAIEEKGREFTEEFGGESTFLIARAGNRSYQRMIQQQFEAHRHILELKETPEQEEAAATLNEKLIARVMAKTILLGWHGNVQYQGQALPYSYENAVKILMHKEFRARIQALSDNYRNYLVSAQKADEKNSQQTSGGTSPGEEVSAV